MSLSFDQISQNKNVITPITVMDPTLGSGKARTRAHYLSWGILCAFAVIKIIVHESASELGKFGLPSFVLIDYFDSVACGIALGLLVATINSSMSVWYATWSRTFPRNATLILACSSIVTIGISTLVLFALSIVYQRDFLDVFLPCTRTLPRIIMFAIAMIVTSILTMITYSLAYRVDNTVGYPNQLVVYPSSVKKCVLYQSFNMTIVSILAMIAFRMFP